MAVGDEAGETGFRFGRGSSDYFIYSLVLTTDAERLRDQLNWLRRKLGWTDREEISFNKTSRNRDVQARVDDGGGEGEEVDKD
ncbi:MAG: hypothetical protein HY023_04630 [Chloroflexi bacterium]|nr:hypothetical protein [Chloroflexota bacterium]